MLVIDQLPTVTSHSGSHSVTTTALAHGTHPLDPKAQTHEVTQRTADDTSKAVEDRDRRHLRRLQHLDLLGIIVPAVPSERERDSLRSVNNGKRSGE